MKADTLKQFHSKVPESVTLTIEGVYIQQHRAFPLVGGPL